MGKDQDQDKGTSFLTSTMLKNQSMTGKGQDMVALNKTMSSFASMNIKAFTLLTKSIDTFNKNVIRLTSSTQQKKDFIRKEDPQKHMIKDLDTLEDLMTESNKLQKKNQEKKSGGLLSSLTKFLPAAAAGAGLFAFLLTGEGKFLNPLIKGMAQFSTKLYGKLYSAGEFVVNTTKNIWAKTSEFAEKSWNKVSGFSEKYLVQPAEKSWNKVSGFSEKYLVQPAEKLWNKVSGFSEKYLVQPIEKSWNKVSGFSEKYLVQPIESGWKIVSEHAANFFGVLKSGFSSMLSHVGGMIGEIGSKIANSGLGKVVGKVGGAVGSFFGGEGAGGKVLAKAGRVAKFFWKKGGSFAAKVVSKEGLAAESAIPIVGAIASGMFAVDRVMKGDYTGAGIDALAGLANASQLIPGMEGIGEVASIALTTANLARDVGREFNPASQKKLAQEKSKKGLFGSMGGMFKNKKTGKGLGDTAVSAVGNKIKSSIVNASQIYRNAGESFKNGTMPGGLTAGMNSKFLSESELSTLIDNAHKAYPNVPTDVIRSIIAQESSGNANAIGKMTTYGTAKGLGQFIDSTADSYVSGGHSNVFNPQANVLGIARYMDDLLKQSGGNISVAAGKYYGTGKPQGGPGMPTTQQYSSQITSRLQNVNGNLPGYNIPNNVSRNSSQIDLSDETIKKFAKEMGTSFKGALPAQQTSRVSVDAGSMRG